MTISKNALLLIGLMAVCALATALWALRTVQSPGEPRFWILLLAAVLTSRLKVKLPGLNGNMAVSLPFLLVAATHLCLFQALLVALPACIAQSLPKRGGNPKTLHMLFNLSTMAVAVGITSALAVYAPPLAGGSFFLAQTIPTAAIIRFTEGGALTRIWTGIAHYSFPFYVLSAGITSLATSSTQFAWQAPLLAIPVLYAIYRSYQSYFQLARG